MLEQGLARCKVLAPLRPAAKSKISSAAVRNGGLPKRYCATGEGRCRMVRVGQECRFASQNVERVSAKKK